MLGLRVCLGGGEYIGPIHAHRTCRSTGQQPRARVRRIDYYSAAQKCINLLLFRSWHNCVFRSFCTGRPSARRLNGFIGDGQTLMIHVENEFNHELEPWITWDKRVSGLQTGRCGHRHSGGPMPAGGECFTPCHAESKQNTKKT